MEQINVKFICILLYFCGQTLPVLSQFPFMAALNPNKANSATQEEEENYVRTKLTKFLILEKDMNQHISEYAEVLRSQLHLVDW